MTSSGPVGDALPMPPPRPPVTADQIRNERRAALVIGNGAYGSLERIPSAAGDAQAVAAALRNLGFQVELVVDADYQVMNRTIGAFGERIGRGGVGFFYYAGHALQLGEENFLMPVDARLLSDDDVSYLGINLGFVLFQFGKSEPRAGIVAVDASRANPNPARLRSVGNGLAPIAGAPARTLLLTAAAPRQAALGMGEARGLMTEALLHVIDEPAIAVQVLLGRIPAAVQQRSGGRQSPWISDTGFPRGLVLRP
jgi:uncharacterized caspase-like protein